MTKITSLLFALICSTITLTAQMTTGMVDIPIPSGATMTAKIDVANEVTLTISGPNDRWFALSFGDGDNGYNMTDIPDAFTVEEDGVFDRTIYGYEVGDVPPDPNTQDWTIVSDAINGSQREIVATRPLDTGDGDDYVFTLSDDHVVILYALGDEGHFMLDDHSDNGDYGDLWLDFQSTANVNELNNIKFSMYPNKVDEDLTLVMPSNITNAHIEIYDLLGKAVITREIEAGFNEFNLSNLNSGIYSVKIIDGKNSFGLKRFVKL